MTYTKYKDIPNRREPQGGRDHIQHIENALTGVVPGPGEVIVGGADGPVATPVDEIGGDPNAVLGAGVRRIIASFDPNHPLEDGDLLVLIETDDYFTDFSDGNAAAWSKPWRQEGTHEIADDAGAAGGKVLRLTAPGTGRHAFVWATPGALTDAEIVFRWRSTSATAAVKGLFRVGGAATTETGVFGGHNTNQALIVARYLNGTRANGGTVGGGFTVAADTWYVTRTQMIGSTVRVRSWPAANPEPTEWTLTDTMTGVDGPGAIGIFVENAATVDIDWVGVSTNGATAPTGS